MPAIYPIGGGKGGVGKSFIAANLGAAMATGGRRVILVDLDVGASNLHTLLGIKSPGKGLSGFLNNTTHRLDQAAVSTHIAGLHLISSCRCTVDVANLVYAQKNKLIKAVRSLPYDAIIIDLGGGTNYNTIDFFTAANSGVVICTPEPTAIENSFRFIKAVRSRRLKQIIRQGSFNDKVKSAVLAKAGGGLGFNAALRCVEEYDPDRLRELKQRLVDFRFHIVINQHRKSTDPTLGLRLQAVCNRHFEAPFQFTGRIDYDERIHDTIYQKKLFVELFPNAPSALHLKHIARELIRYNPIEEEKRNRYEDVGA
jgi:flagellar biosynthesis protein FlhG